MEGISIVMALLAAGLFMRERHRHQCARRRGGFLRSSRKASGLSCLKQKQGEKKQEQESYVPVGSSRSCEPKSGPITKRLKRPGDHKERGGVYLRFNVSLDEFSGYATLASD